MAHASGGTRLDELALAFEAKAVSIVHAIANFDGFIDACKSEEKRIADRRKA